MLLLLLGATTSFSAINQQVIQRLKELGIPVQTLHYIAGNFQQGSSCSRSIETSGMYSAPGSTQIDYRYPTTANGSAFSLTSVNNASPSAQDEQRYTQKYSHGYRLLEWMDESSLKLVEDNAEELVLEFYFRPLTAEEADPILNDCRGELHFDRAGHQLKKIVVTNERLIKKGNTEIKNFELCQSVKADPVSNSYFIEQENIVWSGKELGLPITKTEKAIFTKPLN